MTHFLSLNNHNNFFDMRLILILFFRHYGRAEPIIDVPESTNPYVISGFAIHPIEGLSIVKEPVMVRLCSY